MTEWKIMYSLKYRGYAFDRLSTDEQKSILNYLDRHREISAKQKDLMYIASNGDYYWEEVLVQV